MSINNQEEIADRLNRLVKLAMDTGEADSIEEALKIFSGYKLAVAVGPEAHCSTTLQAALLTIINAGSRSLLGGIEVEGDFDAPLLTTVPPYETLAEAIIGLGGRIVERVDDGAPLVTLGSVGERPGRAFELQSSFNGWAGGVTPRKSAETRLPETAECTPAGVFAGALAVTEAFQFLRGGHPAAGKRAVGLSLWRPDLDWRASEAKGPALESLPSSLWLIGLGNLGQAFLWVLGLLPYASPKDMRLVLQDFDTLVAANKSTSLLTNDLNVGKRKTRAMAAWAEQRGFQADIVERRFAANFKVNGGDPCMALCGVDNALARSALEDVGFKRVIEAGLGGGPVDFLGLRTHAFPGPRSAKRIWGLGSESQGVNLDLPAYRSLGKGGLDRCGLTQLAGRTVGAPFVGAVAACLVIGEVLRTLHGGRQFDLIDTHLREIEHRTVLPADNTEPFNPGSTTAYLF